MVVRTDTVGLECSKALFLPHYGEWGWFVLNYMPLVHYFDADDKIVCCQQGQEVYFPSASGYFYDWANPIPDELRRGWRDYGHRMKRMLVKRLQREFPTYAIIDQTKLPRMDYRAFAVRPRTVRNLRFDVVLGPRMRTRAKRRNWPHWGALADRLVERDLTVGVVGSEYESFHIANAHGYSWNFPDSDATVEMLQNCRVYVGTNSGISHLAAFLSTPMIQFDCDPEPSRWIELMRSVSRATFRRLDSAAWLDADVVLKSVVDQLSTCQRSRDSAGVEETNRSGVASSILLPPCRAASERHFARVGVSPSRDRLPSRARAHFAYFGMDFRPPFPTSVG